MTKKQQRQAVYDKYGGRCAYCGCELNGKFHVDEIEPCQRTSKFLLDEEGSRIWDPANRKYKTKVIVQRPDRLHIDNQNPACASCNINKHDLSLEDYRSFIAGFMKHLNERSTQYKFAKKYGLIVETGSSVTFYFENIQTDQP